MTNEPSIDQLFLNKVNEAIENNLANENFGVDELALETGISRSQLHRRLNSLTGKSASQTIKEFRLKKALEMLQNNVGNASEISYQVGFKNPSHFNASFKKYFGYPPGKVKLMGSFKKGDKPVTSRRWKIASYISFAVIVGLIVLNVIARSSNKEILEKSIAVLPFRNDSPDQERMYFINGTFEAILDNLCKIEDMRVVSRNSVEQYRNNPKPTPVVAEEMDVGYVLEGSGHRDGDRIRLFVQLFDGKKDKHLWSKSYDSDIDEIFSMLSEIAQSVAEEIKAIVTPEEKQLIEKIPTRDLIAYDFYQRGIDEYHKGEYEIAKDYFYKALKYDSTFALAYTGLARVYWDKLYWKTYFSENFLDSVLILADKAISHDNQLAEAYTVRGDYYRETGQTEKAINEYDKAITFNPNDWMAYRGKGSLYQNDDLVECIYNIQKATALYHGLELPDLLRSNSYAHISAGFIAKAKYYSQQAFKLDGDSVNYFLSLARPERNPGNFENAIQLLKKGFSIDSNHIHTLLQLGINYMFLGQFEESLIYFEKYVEGLETLGFLNPGRMHWIGYVYQQNGYKEKAEYYINKQIDYCITMNELGRSHGIQHLETYYWLAEVYASRGQKAEAYKNLKIYNQRQRATLWNVTQINKSPFFNGIRSEPEFQKIVKDVEAKYMAQHERVRKWLEENDLL